jgi:serine/threonine protein kinase
VEKFLGGGGQGEVYQARITGNPVALKWYFPSNATEEQHDNLSKLVAIEPPNDRFLWPMNMMKAEGCADFGYVMNLRPPEYKGIVDLMKGKIDPTFSTLATAGYQLADSFLQIHSKGLCYRDISFGNVFLDPTHGDILICDNDNVTINGQSQSGVLGTPRFMAPEIVRGEKPPSTATDLFSLSVLLFYMFVLHHPLEGKKEASIHCMDIPAMNQLYGFDPIFIFDPQNDNNRPVPGYQDNAINIWPILPEFLKDKFILAFTKGLNDPEGNLRVKESEWRVIMIQLRDSIFHCARCGAENFFNGGNEQYCWKCKEKLQSPVRLRIGRNEVMLNYNTKLYPHHLDVEKPNDFSKSLAEMTQHPSNPNIWGLKNLGDEKWVCTTVMGDVKDVAPGRSVSIAKGTRIGFGNCEGEICA